MTEIHVLVTSDVSAIENKILISINVVGYINASLACNILYWD